MSRSRHAGLSGFVRVICPLLFLCLGPVWETPAQTTLATIRGNVVDSFGTSLSGIVITIQDIDRNITHSTKSDEIGSFALTMLPPAIYAITAERDGYKRYVREGIVLHPDQMAPLNIVLEAVAAPETTRISADARLIETQLSSGGTNIAANKFLILPLNGRDFNQLALLSPGVLSAVPQLQAMGFRGAMNVNSSRSFSNIFILDGVDNLSGSSSLLGGSIQVVQPSLEAVQDFKIIAHNQPAEYGRNAGAVVMAITRGGTRSFHGSLYDFYQGDTFNARNYFSNAYRQEAPDLNRNQFGASAGGPAGKGIYWFADYEGVQGREGTLRVLQVPDAATKAGIFDLPVYDPFSAGRPQFSKSERGQWIIPSNRRDAVGARILSLIPDPNVLGTSLFASTPVSHTRADQFNVRLDGHPKANLDLFGRYSFSKVNVNQPAPLPGLAEGSFNAGFGTNRNRSLGFLLGATWTITPTIISDFRFGLTRAEYSAAPPNAGVDGPAAVGLKNAPNDSRIVGGLPTINLEGYDSLGRFTSTPESQKPSSWTGKGSFSVARGRHLYKYGGEVAQTRTRIDDSYAGIGGMAFDRRFTGNAVGDLLSGLPSSLGLASRVEADLSQNIYSLYFQDDFQLTPKFSWNYGVRYEYATPPLEAQNRLTNFDVEGNEWVYAKDGSTFKRALVHPDQKNWGPRIGAAYAIASRWVLRGGYGRFYMLSLRQGREGMLAYNPPFMTDSLLVAEVFGATAVSSAAPFRLAEGYPQGLLDPVRGSRWILRRAQDIDQRVPYTQNYNIGAQREFSKNTVLDVSYVGNKGNKLPGFRNLNPKTVLRNTDGSQSSGPRPYAEFGDIQYMENRVISTYHSLQAKLERRFSGGFSALFSHTWGKTIAEGSDALSVAAGGPGADTGASREPQDGNNLRAERGPAEFDIAHRFVASYVVELPWGRGRRWGRDWGKAADLLLGGWQLSGINVLQGGPALTPRIGGSNVLYLGRERSARPYLVGVPVLPLSERTAERWFNTGAFAPFSPAPQAFGNAGIGILRGPETRNFDFALAKDFRFSDKRDLQLRADCFNAFNHTNFGQPDMRRESAGFGRITTAGHARLFQFAARLVF